MQNAFFLDPYQRLQALLETTSDWIWEVDRNGIVRYSNPRCWDLLGYTREELLGSSIFDLIEPDKQAFFRKHFQNLLKQRSGFDKELNPNVHKDGHLVILESSVRPFFDADGMVIGFRGSDRDVTERERHQETLEEQRRQLESMMDNCPGAVYRCQADPDFSLTFLSRAGIDVFGLDNHAIDLKILPSFKQLIHPDDFATVSHITLSALEHHQRFTLEYRIIDCQGREKYVWERGSGIYNRHNQLIGLEGIILDISGNKRAEQDRRAIDRQIQQSQHRESLGILAGGIAHDFNNILMAIMGHSEIAKLHAANNTSCQSSLNQVIQATQRASDLCRQMLAYAGKSSFQQLPLSLCDIVEEMITLLATNISKKAHIERRLDHDIPLILADPSQIRQVVMNLLLNASDALADGHGTITIACSYTYCDHAFLVRHAPHHPIDEGTFAILSIRDDGCGMDTAIQKRIFDPFYSTKTNGRGLGLSAVMGIIKAYNGFITLESSPGSGSSFTCYFPTTAVTSPSTALATDADSMDPKGCVLFVDDDADLRDIARYMLESLGYETQLAEHGKAALQLIEQHGACSYSAIILDLTMPTMDGGETLHHIRRQSSTVPVIIASGYGKDDVDQHLAGKHVNGFLQKPFTLSDLTHCIREVREDCTPISDQKSQKTQ